MKRMIYTAIGLFAPLFLSYAQSVSGQISISPVIIKDGLALESVGILHNKLSNIVVNNGCGTCSYPDRFVISASVDLISNSIAPTNPPRVSKQLEITLIVGDFIENKTFSSCRITLNGLGTSDVKSEIAALNRLSFSQKDIKSMIEKAKQEIVDYYGSNTARFLSNAKTLELKGNYDEAISYLMSIPPVNDKCFAECQDYAINLYQKKIDSEGYSLYNFAKAEWIADKSPSGAYKACQFLKKINTSSNCFSDAMVLWDQISEKLDADEKEAKEAVRQQYYDNLEMQKTQMKNHQTFRTAIIDACKVVGTAYGEHRPQNVTKIIRGWL